MVTDDSFMTAHAQCPDVFFSLSFHSLAPTVENTNAHLPCVPAARQVCRWAEQAPWTCTVVEPTKLLPSSVALARTPSSDAASALSTTPRVSSPPPGTYYAR